MRILLVEDNQEIAQTMKEELRRTYAIDVSLTGQNGCYMATTSTYDLIILDLILPDMNGVEICKTIRNEGIKTPILILTGKDEIELKVRALDCGADDYLTKPFSFKELTARIRALLRRSSEKLKDNKLLLDGLEINIAERTVIREGHVIDLRRKEFDLLEYMMRNNGRVLTRSMILEHVWDNNVDFFTNAIDVHVKYLRDRIDKPFKKKLIKTIHGLGYKIQA